ncbi:acyltransferase [Pedobacter sp. SYP-B3415]|uniref:acyltransferase n=1 Tax=Pedobacter sp. SYP-B3415 TaxID=2496641 RepID=UPI00101D385F|nr:acyltransferase [Pedobacter sp. SYP-B3415]
MEYFKHRTAEVLSTQIGRDTKIWQFCVILGGAKIGANCNICSHVLIENDVTIGNDVTIKSGVQVWDGLQVGNKVFIGPNVTFTNDLFPRSKVYPERFERTIIEDNASIGANATIIAGNFIGRNALIGAGSVVTKNIPANTIWFGNPAVHRGYITDEGIVLSLSLIDEKTGDTYIIKCDKIVKNG